MPTDTPRQRFLAYVRDHRSARAVCSPFLPHASVIEGTLRHVGLPVDTDPITSEITLSRHLDYEPMFMAELTGLIFDWRDEPERSDAVWEVATIQTSRGEWVRRRRRGHVHWNDEVGCPVTAHTARMVDAVRGHRHIYSTTDGVLEGTPPENYIAFVETIRRLTE